MMRAVAIVGKDAEVRSRLCTSLARVMKERGITCALVCGGGVDTGNGPFESLARVSAAGVTVSWPDGKSLEDLVPHLGAEFIFFDGGGERRMPRILLPGHDENERPLAMASNGCDVDGVKRVDDIDALVTVLLERAFLLPGLDCGSCGQEECDGMALEIVAGRVTLEECVALSPPFEVSVGGKDMAMNPFVAGSFKAVVRAMLEQLKGYAPGPVRIRMDTSGK